MALLLPTDFHKLCVKENPHFYALKPKQYVLAQPCRLQRVRCTLTPSLPVSSLSLSLFRWPLTHVPGSPGPRSASRPESAPASEAGRREESPWPRAGGPGTPALPTEAGVGWSLLAASLSLSVPGPWRGKGVASCLSDLFVALPFFFLFFSPLSLGRGFGISPDVSQLQGLFWLATDLSLATFWKASWNC